MSDARLTRRDLLVRSAAGAAALHGASILGGCTTDAGGGLDTDTDAAARPAPPVDPPDAEVPILKGPFVTLQGPSAARLRFETREDVPLAVWLEDADGGAWYEPVRNTVVVQYERPTLEDGPVADEPGAHTLHDVLLEGLSADSVIAWSVASGGDVHHEGSFRMPPIGSGTVRLGWIADTMAPWQPALGNYQHMPGKGIDVLIHGGDLTYNSSILDTWNNLFFKLGPMLSTAAFHPAIGNHDSDMPHELEDMFDRLFDEQGDGRGGRFHAFTAGVLRVILLDSESDGEGVLSEEQLGFLEAELDAAEADEGIRSVMLGFHRPFITLSKYWSEGRLPAFDRFHALITGRVDAVWTGHVHGFEHFELDGVHYVIEGRGGSPQYDVDEHVEDARAVRPELVEARLHAGQGYGFSTLDVAEDGTVTVTRWQAEDGSEDLSFTISPRA